MRKSLFYISYAFITTLLAPVAGLVFLFHRRGKIRLSERFAAWGSRTAVSTFDWWFHAASVGEVGGLIPLLTRIKSDNPDQTILLTATSPTAFENSNVVALCDEYHLAPFDVPWIVNRLLRQISAKHFVITETELWPVLLKSLLKKEVKCFAVNARISSYTASRYKFIARLFSPLLRRLSAVCADSVTSAELFLSLGVPSGLIHITGNTKYESRIEQLSVSERLQLKQNLFPNISEKMPIVVLGSIHPTEEQFWLDCAEKYLGNPSQLKLVIAPRHMERIGYFEDQLRKRKLNFIKLSQCDQSDNVSGCDVVLVDSMGRLNQLYAVASLAFVGGSLVDIGGHNPVEPAQASVPICIGPHHSVVAGVIEELSLANAIRIVTSSDDVYQLIEQVVTGDRDLAASGAKAKEVVSKHQGATARVLEILTQ